jgi:hypothetical protein
VSLKPNETIVHLRWEMRALRDSASHPISELCIEGSFGVVIAIAALEPRDRELEIPYTDSDDNSVPGGDCLTLFERSSRRSRSSQ